jgi:hypothetical protein
VVLEVMTMPQPLTNNADGLYPQVCWTVGETTAWYSEGVAVEPTITTEPPAFCAFCSRV